MKTRFFGGKDGFKHALLLAIMLLSACAASPQVVEAEQTHRPVSTTPQAAPMTTQKPASVEVQPPGAPPQADTRPIKRKHNVEED